MAIFMIRRTFASLAVAAAACAAAGWGAAFAADKASQVPAIGEVAPAFELAEAGGGKKSLESATKKGPAVVVVLRGNPGYVCPACTAQYGDFVGKAEGFKKAGAEVLFIYPGPAEKLEEHAKSFVRGKEGNLPEHFHVLLDPDYGFTNAYGLRWEGKNETAYPAVFVVNGDGKVTFAAVSKVHGGRTPAADVLKALRFARGK